MALHARPARHQDRLRLDRPALRRLGFQSRPAQFRRDPRLDLLLPTGGTGHGRPARVRQDHQYHHAGAGSRGAGFAERPRRAGAGGRFQPRSNLPDAHDADLAGPSDLADPGSLHRRRQQLGHGRDGPWGKRGRAANQPHLRHGLRLLRLRGQRLRHHSGNSENRDHARRAAFRSRQRDDRQRHDQFLHLHPSATSQRGDQFHAPDLRQRPCVDQPRHRPRRRRGGADHRPGLERERPLPPARRQPIRLRARRSVFCDDRRDARQPVHPDRRQPRRDVLQPSPAGPAPRRDLPHARSLDRQRHHLGRTGRRDRPGRLGRRERSRHPRRHLRVPPCGRQPVGRGAWFLLHGHRAPNPRSPRQRHAEQPYGHRVSAAHAAAADRRRFAQT